MKKPVVVHTREAMAETLEILREFRPRLVGGIMHCFGGSLEEAHAGTRKSFSIELEEPCPTCAGRGREPGRAPR